MNTSSTQQHRLSETVQQLKPSGIRRFFDLASTMDNVISLGVGEPDFVTPWNVREASIVSMERGFTSYTANAGLIELRRAVSYYLENSFGVSYHPESDIVITVGASEGIDAAFRAIINPGDEVIVAEPCFVSYAPIITMAGGVPVPLETTKKHDFKINAGDLEGLITSKTKAVLLSYPNNPTGAHMSKEELEPVVKVIKDYDLLAVSDEIYAELSYDYEHASLPAFPGMLERTILISGFSKAFAMTGWRVGYVCGPKDIMAAVLKIHQYTMMCASTSAQFGALEALKNGRADVEKMVASYRQRRNYLVKTFAEMGLECHTPLGAFYAFPSIEKLGMDAETFAETFLTEEQVAVVPGTVFGSGGEGHVRCSYATSLESLVEAMERFKRFMDRHR
ncbi:aminotransferase [Marinococcus luteus]|uniref:Aminotransferase n=1 Tax=Marinococcus luteus TaxID=1122204 RepID=A0A1H2XLV1_9BACI|nr:aminotransferase [Marinococcus luteus]SDW93825.1 aminotransferase [Marinococcus luteus]